MTATSVHRGLEAGESRFGAKPVRIALALATFGSGVMNLASVLGTTPVARRETLRDVFPLEFQGWSGHLLLLLGFGLVVTSINIYKRKHRALLVAVVIAALSTATHLSKRATYAEAATSGALLVVLWASRRTFTVKSELPAFSTAALRLGAFLLAALGYAVAGFWFLDRRDFGVNFTLGDSIARALRFLTWTGDPGIVAHTRFARWFLESLYLTSGAGLLYAAFALYSPVVFRLRTVPLERSRAKALVEQFGTDPLDYFKTWPDKEFFFGSSEQSFISYRVGAGMAVALGDPVGAAGDMEATVREFTQFCADNDWRSVFYQVGVEHLDAYRRMGLRRLKVGEDAIVDLGSFTLAGSSRKAVRNTITKLEKVGLRFRVVDPPVPDATLSAIAAVSDEWLQMPGRRERRFSLGRFDRGYLAGTRLFLVEDAGGRILAFANEIRSQRAKEATIDLMRHRQEVPNGAMDFLFVKVFGWSQEQGFERFNMGMAPMSGFQEREKASAGERAVHGFVQNLNFLFSFRGLRFFKAKYATSWEPRYVVYHRVADLARLAIALRKVTEIR